VLSHNDCISTTGSKGNDDDDDTTQLDVGRMKFAGIKSAQSEMHLRKSGFSTFLSTSSKES